MSQKRLLIDIINLLNSVEIPYYLTGSWALSYYAQPRSTHDIDFVVNLFQKDVSRFFNAFDKDRYMISKQSITDAIFYKTQFQITDRQTGFWIDFWIPKDDEFNRTVFARRKRVRLFNMDTCLPTPEDLILSKLVWSNISGGSKLQRRDVETIFTFQKELDKKYIDKWVNKLNLKEEYDKIK